jgi:LuxR family transcriptional regulator, maltose regulon positive regulatory protein
VKDTRDRTQLPPLFRRHTRRPRLTGALDEAKAQAILLNAPAGYGKTTLAQEWLQGRDHVAWYRATSASADVAAFSSGLADVVAPIVPGAGDRLKQRLRIGDAPDRAVRPLAELMAEDLAAWPDDGIVVIDDYHLVTDSAAVEEFVDWLLTLVPVRMLVTTRRRPSWASARRVLYGEIVEIGPEQLAMNDEEASQVLGGRPSDAVRALVRQAQGWPALIGLAALSASLELPEERVSDALFRYFAEEVLRSEPPEVQRFMLLASVPLCINPRIAREVLAYEDAEALVERFRQRDLADESQAPDGDLRLHPLLRDFLRRKLEADDPDAFRRYSLSAIEDARNQRSWEEAFELIREAGDPKQVVRLVGEASRSLLDAGRIETVEKWLAFCQAEATEAPEAQLARSEVLTWRGRLAESAMVAETLVSSLSSASRLYSRASYVAGRALHLISEDEAALGYHLRAKETAKEQRHLEDALWGCFIAAGELELQEAEGFLGELDSIPNPSPDTRLRLAEGWVIAAQRRGSYAGIWRKMKALIDMAATPLDPMVRSSFLARAADLNVSRGEFQTAYDLAMKAHTLCSELNLDFAKNLCLLIRANAEIGLRTFQHARKTVAEIQDARVEDPYIDLGIKLITIKLALSEGRRIDPVGELSPPPAELQRSGQGAYWSLLAIATARHDVEASLNHAERSRELSEAVEPRYYADFAELIARRQDSSGDDCQSRLEDLLISCSTDEALESFILAYRSDPSLLSQASRTRAASAVMRTAIGLGNDLELARRLGVQVTTEEAVSLASLTPREQEVLRLLARGMTNVEIAESLFISQSTTKVHVHHILEKLNAKTRLQAALRARELDLG